MKRILNTVLISTVLMSSVPSNGMDKLNSLKNYLGKVPNLANKAVDYTGNKLVEFGEKTDLKLNNSQSLLFWVLCLTPYIKFNYDLIKEYKNDGPNVYRCFEAASIGYSVLSLLSTYLLSDSIILKMCKKLNLQNSKTAFVQMSFLVVYLHFLFKKDLHNKIAYNLTDKLLLLFTIKMNLPNTFLI